MEEAEVESFEDFRLFVISILGLSVGTAESYVSYVRGVCKLVGKRAREIVASTNAMRDAIDLIGRDSGLKNTRRNYVSGLKAFWRYCNGYEYGASNVCENGGRPDVAFDVREQLNDLELRVSDSDATFWNRIMDVALLSMTIVPTLLTLGGIKAVVRWFLLAAMIFGVAGVFALIPILRRPIRQNTDLYQYGKKLIRGEVSGFEFSPEETTARERVCMHIVRTLIPLSMFLIFVSVFLSV